MKEFQIRLNSNIRRQHIILFENGTASEIICRGKNSAALRAKAEELKAQGYTERKTEAAKDFDEAMALCETDEERKAAASAMAESVREEPTFAERLTKARKAAGLTQEAMAQRLQIPKRTIEDWSTGKSSPPAWTQPLLIQELERIAAEK